MRISFEGQAFINSTRTGVGLYTYNLVKNIITIDLANQYQINIFDFLNRNKSKDKVTELFRGDGNDRVHVRECILIPYGVYARFQELFRFVFYETLLNSKVDIVHFFNFILPRKIKSKTINTVHDMNYIRYPETMSKTNYNIHRKNLQRSCRDADFILTVSQNSKNEIMEFMNVSPDKIDIASPAVDTNIFHPIKDCGWIKDKYKIPGGYILYFGTLEPRKNITSIIKAFKTVSEKNADINLVLAGQKGWMYEEIFRLIQDLHLQDRVVFTGYVPEEDAPALYSCAEAFVFPSLYEGFGMPPLEAMACGTPVIVSNTSSLPEVVGDAGILVDPHDIENISFEMDRLINDSEVRKTLSEKGLEQSRKFTWEDSARKVIEVYNRLA